MLRSQAPDPRSWPGPDLPLCDAAHQAGLLQADLPGERHVPHRLHLPHPGHARPGHRPRGIKTITHIDPIMRHFIKVSLPEFMTEIAFLTPSSGLDQLTAKWCSEQSKTQDLCYNILFTVTGQVKTIPNIQFHSS